MSDLPSSATRCTVPLGIRNQKDSVRELSMTVEKILKELRPEDESRISYCREEIVQLRVGLQGYRTFIELLQTCYQVVHGSI